MAPSPPPQPQPQPQPQPPRPSSPPPPLHTPRSSPRYARLRARFFNARLPPHAPALIAAPRTTADVAAAIQHARTRALRVGVRAGGHHFSAPSLVAADESVLVDTRHLNRGFRYDAATNVAAFGPGITGAELARELAAVGRFWPFGHSPGVGVGGFLLAGGQGWFMRGWGATGGGGEAGWVEKLEVVMPDGVARVVGATGEGADIFWAARGAGCAFFGVVTRVWARTVRARRVWDAQVVFSIGGGGEAFAAAMGWVLETNDRSPRYGVETAVVTCYADRGEEGARDKIEDRTLLLVVNCTAWADSLEEARVLLSPWAQVPEALEGRLVARVPVKETSWAELFKAQDELNPSGNGERWQCDSIFNDPKAPREKLIEAIKPAFCDLPTRKSVGCLYIADYYPDERDQAMSLPQQCHISTMTCWYDPALDEQMKKWMFDAYERAQPVSCGQYIADFDENHRITKVMTETALRKFLKIREKYDPQEMFVGHRGISKILQKPLSKI